MNTTKTLLELGHCPSLPTEETKQEKPSSMSREFDRLRGCLGVNKLLNDEECIIEAVNELRHAKEVLHERNKAEREVSELKSQLTRKDEEIAAGSAAMVEMQKELTALRLKTDERGILSVTEADETYREKSWKMMYSSVFQSLEEERMKVSDLQQKLQQAEDSKLRLMQTLVQIHHATGTEDTRNEETKVREWVARARAAESRLAQMEWVPVSEMPPKEDADENGYILWRSGGYVVSSSYGISKEVILQNRYTHWQRLSPLPSPPVKEDKFGTTRAKFESMFAGRPTERDEDGEYLDSDTELCWIGWQAALESSNTPSAP